MKVGVVDKDNVESKLKMQLIISTGIMTVLMIPIQYILPEVSSIPFAGKIYEPSSWALYGCIIVGLWAGLLIGWITEIFTSNQY